MQRHQNQRRQFYLIVYNHVIDNMLYCYFLATKSRLRVIVMPTVSDAQVLMPHHMSNDQVYLVSVTQYNALDQSVTSQSQVADYSNIIITSVMFDQLNITGFHGTVFSHILFGDVKIVNQYYYLLVSVILDNKSPFEIIKQLLLAKFFGRNGAILAQDIVQFIYDQTKKDAEFMFHSVAINDSITNRKNDINTIKEFNTDLWRENLDNIITKKIHLINNSYVLVTYLRDYINLNQYTTDHIMFIKDNKPVIMPALRVIDSNTQTNPEPNTIKLHTGTVVLDYPIVNINDYEANMLFDERTLHYNKIDIVLKQSNKDMKARIFGIKSWRLFNDAKYAAMVARLITDVECVVFFTKHVDDMSYNQSPPQANYKYKILFTSPNYTDDVYANNLVGYSTIIDKDVEPRDMFIIK